jgi:hypothetical protein
VEQGIKFKLKVSQAYIIVEENKAGGHQKETWKHKKDDKKEKYVYQCKSM